MSAFLKNTLFICSVVVTVLFATDKANAQCAVSTQKGSSATITTSGENYQYINAADGYYAVSVQTVLTKINGAESYTIKIVYTGNVLHSNPLSISFKTSTGSSLVKKIRLSKVVKNDNAKLRTKNYTVLMSATDIAYVQQLELDYIELNFGNNLKPIGINVNQPKFLKEQINCVTNQ